MAKKCGIEYVNFYTEGSAARKIVPTLRAIKATLPKPKKIKRRVIYMDPVAMLGMAVAVFMLVMMFVGLAELQAVRQQTLVMEQYVQQLDAENAQLSEVYSAGCDLEEVERTALALGMVPKSQVQQTTIQLTAPQVQETTNVTLWEQIGTFLSALFA